MSFLDVPTQFWSEWGLRVYVISSLVAIVLLSLLSWTRRRSASGWWRAVPLWFVTRIVLWIAYQGAEIAGTGALGSLSLSGSDASAEADQEVIAFWAPFLLMHLGGPDTMTAYAMEDNTMSLRKLAEMVFQVLGAFYAQYKYIYSVRSWTLLATASAIMLLVGVARYVEKWYALGKSNSMMEEDGGGGGDDDEDSSMKEEEEEAWSSSDPEVAGAGSTTSSKKVCPSMSDDDALCLAQDLFHVCRRALADSSVVLGSEKHRASRKIFQLGWKSMCKVVEMELSLMYEALYTKAIVLHTRPVVGYLIRLLSPLATAAAVFLFNQYMDFCQDQGIAIRGLFVKITYLFLGFALAMDVVWLLRALGSTWTYATLKDKAAAWPWSSHWLRHHLLCSGRWRRLHLVVEYPVQWLFCRDDWHPVTSWRSWSGTIGRYNLLDECSAAGAHRHRRRPWWLRWFCSWLKKNWDLEEMKYLRELHHDVKKLLIERVRLKLLSITTKDPNDGYNLVDIRTLWGQKALNLKVAKELFVNKDEKLPKFGREFEEDVLLWHIATCVFLSSNKVTIPESSTSTDHLKEAIEAMSEYLMFFVAVRRHMLPDLVLHNLFEKTHQALRKIWDKEGKKETTGSSSSSTSANNTPKDKLADILLKKAKAAKREVEWRLWFRRHDGSILVHNAAVVAGNLIHANKRDPQQMLEFIFNVWLDKLLYAAVRCSRENHAKQLSRGGDLTTILWLIVQHAGLFRVGETMPSYEETQEKMKKEIEEEKMKKKPKKKEEKKAAPPADDAWDYPPQIAAAFPPPQPHIEEFEDEEDDDDLPTGYIELY